MIPEFEILYKQATGRGDLTRWLRDGDLVKDYEDSVRFAQEEQEHLLRVLSGDDLKRFRCYLDNKEYQTDAEFRIVFSEGLSMGLRLGSLCSWG